MSSITEFLNTQMKELRSKVSTLESKMKEGQAELKSRIERQQRRDLHNGTKARQLQESIEVTRRELDDHLAAGEIRSQSAGVGGTGGNLRYSNSTTIRRCNILGSVPRHFEATAVQNNWTANEKAGHF
jgi:hypothetical protein